MDNNHTRRIRRGEDARWRVLHHLLELLNQSRLGEHCVLRGSLLLKARLGDAAYPASPYWRCNDHCPKDHPG